jgi:hypothetical protein
MSHNYYLRWPPATPCKTCGHANDRDDLMIGHAGGGWVFLWRGYHSGNDARTNGAELGTPGQWFTFLAGELAGGAVIVDSYRGEHTLGEFLATVVNKRLPLDGEPPSRHSALRPGSAVASDGDDIDFSEFE